MVNMQNIIKTENIKENSDFDELKDIIEKLIVLGEKEDVLMSMYRLSTWTRIRVNGLIYVAGIIRSDTIGFGVPVFSKRQFVEELGSEAVFIPLSDESDECFGYRLLFKRKASLC